MTDTPRYLITTADERTWKFDRPVVFLGEWCRIYERKRIWENMDAIVAVPYGLGQACKDADHAQARALEEKLFPVLCATLNQYHSAQHGARFWHIVLGHWFRRFVDAMLNRVKTLEQCLSNYRITGTTVFADDRYSLATQNSYEAIWAFNDDRWNNELNKQLLKLMNVGNLIQETIMGDASDGFSWRPGLPEVSCKRKVLNWGYQRVTRLASMLARKNDAFIINSYLPKKEEFKLHLVLGQFPQLWRSPTLRLSKTADRELRNTLSRQVEVDAGDKLGNLTRAMLFDLLPICYLEGFNNLHELVQQQRWPRSPKFIFTSNNFDTDELFKLWTALKVQSGTKYVIGQHGNNYGTYRYTYPSIEEVTADRFLTWGWTDGLPQHKPAFILKTVGQKEKTHDTNGGLLLIEDMTYHRLDSWDRTHEFKSYFADQIAFIEKLQNIPRQHLTIRLHHTYKYSKSFEVDRWRDFDPRLRIELGVLPIQRLVDQSRLIIHSYDSTGILETLSQNIPTMAFWQNNFDHLRESAKPYYQVLVDAGIVHLSPGSLAMQVNEIWDDVEGWWTKISVQEARLQFCNRYARTSQNPACDLKSIFGGIHSAQVLTSSSSAEQKFSSRSLV